MLAGMRVVDTGDEVTLANECPCGQRFVMVAHFGVEVEGLARWCYVERMRRASRRVVVRHCRMGARSLN